jgi:acyl-CoA thioesterase I
LPDEQGLACTGAQHARVRVLALVLIALVGGACGELAEHFSSGNKMGVSTTTGSGMLDEKDGATTKRNAPVIYVALGDSTGVGVGAQRGGGYVARLFERIEREHKGSEVVNLCASGARTDDVLRTQLPRVATAHPTLVTVAIGINDVTNNVPGAQFARNYETIITQLQSVTSAPIVASNIPDISYAPAVPAYARAEARRCIELFNSQIAERARRHNVTLIDAYSLTRDIVPSHLEFFSADGFHPSDAGYEYWAKMMWPAVQDVLNK